MLASGFLTLIGDASDSLAGLADIVFECAGSSGIFMEALRLVRPRGTIASLGCCPTPDPIVPIQASLKEVRLLFPFGYSAQEFSRCAEQLDRGRIDPKAMITSRIGLDDLPDMFERLRGANPECKVLVDPWMTGAG